MDKHQRIVCEVEEKEKTKCEAQVTLESYKILFPLWTLERIFNEAVDNPSIHWLKPVASFDLENMLDLQFDMPLTPKAFLFRSFVVVANASDSDTVVDNQFMEFYLKHGKPQFQTWSSQKITTVKVVGPVRTESFLNAKLKTTRGSKSSGFEFSLANLPCLNPYDWITLLHFLMKYEKKYEPLVEHIKRMLVSYIYEVAKRDVEITSVLKRKPTVLPQASASDVNN